MRISDWSSDVCSSDLQAGRGGDVSRPGCGGYARAVAKCARHPCDRNARHRNAGAGGTRPLCPSGTAVPLWRGGARSEEHTAELQSLMRSSYAFFCLQKYTTQITTTIPGYTIPPAKEEEQSRH